MKAFDTDIPLNSGISDTCEARALALANEAAIAHGTDPTDSLVTIEEQASSTGRLWRINYGPRDYVGRRGGDLIVVVDEASNAVQRIIRGQ